jgi:PIN domain nuclease of toxin-antitoxin system
MLDTRVFLWMVTEPDRLSQAARAAVADTDNVLFLSGASAWEIAIKSRRLGLPEPARVYVPSAMRRARVTPLGITHDHALAVADLPDHHRDPFDRLLVAQAQLEGLTLVTADTALTSYNVPLLWAPA